MTRRQKAISFLKKQAIAAYQSGNIGKVRHLSGITLEKVLEDGREDIEFNDILWAFIFMILYPKSNRDFFVIIDRAYEKFGFSEDQLAYEHSSIARMQKKSRSKRPTTDISPYIPLLNFVLDILKPDWTHLDEHYKALCAINISSLPECGDVANELLLTKVIEFWWYIDNESDRWERLAAKWKQELSKDSKQHKLIDQLWSRLIIQQYLLGKFAPNEVLQLMETSSLQQDDPAGYLMAHAWFCVFFENWNKLDNLFLKMKKSIPFESEYALSYQGLINSTKFIRQNEREANCKRLQDGISGNWEVDRKRIRDGIYGNNEHLPIFQMDFSKEPQGEVPDDDSTDIAGILRYQRIQLTRPVALFHFQWRASFDEDMLELKNKPHGNASERANMLALVMLLELEALRLWDLGMYQGAIKRQRELSLNLGMYHDQQGTYTGWPSSLKNALILTVRSADSKIDESGEITRAENLIEVLQEGEGYINEVTATAVRTPPMQYPSALVMLEILGDAVSFAYLADIAQWSVRMFHQYQFSRFRFNLKCFNFWKTIFEYHIIPEAVWDILDPVISRLFDSPPYWRTSDEVLQLALRKAPVEKARQWAAAMASFAIGDDHMDRERYQILFNSAIENKALRDIVDEYLSKRIKEKKTSPEVAFWTYEQRLLHSPDELPLEVEEIQQYLINRLKQRCQAIQSTRQGYSFYGGMNWDFARVNWLNCPMDQLSGVVQLIDQTICHSANITTSDVRDLLLVLSNIARTAPNQFAGDVAKLVHRIIENTPQAYDGVFSGGPLSGFSMNRDIADEIKYAIVRIVTRLYQFVEEKDRMTFRDWALHECFTTEALNLGFLSSLFCYVYLLGNDEIKKQAVNGLQIIYSRVQKGEGLAYVLGSLSAVLRERRTGSFKQKTLNLKEDPLLLEFFNRFITISYKYPDPEVREGCALLAKEIAIAGGDSDSEIKEQLKRDVRARVRVAINES